MQETLSKGTVVSRSFPGLPSDVWTEIITSLEPLDVLTLNLVCKVLHDLLCERHTWVSVLRAICEKHAIFLPSFYPLSEMDLKQLQRTALGRLRWANLIRKNAAQLQNINSPITLAPKSVSAFPHSVLSSEVNGQGERLLIPGGRFLLIGERNEVLLWDLGAAGRSPLLDPLLVDKLVFKPKDGTFLSVTVIPNGMNRLKVAVALEAKTSNEDLVKIYVYTIAPNEQKATFRLLASLTTCLSSLNRFAGSPQMGFFFSLSGDRLFMRTSGRSIVWDFVHGNYALGHGNISALPFQVVFTGDLVIELESDSVYIWKIPALDCRTQDSPVIILDARSTPAQVLYPKKHSLKYPFQSEGPENRFRNKIVVRSGWNQTPDLPIIFDLFRPSEVDDDLDCVAAEGLRYQLKVDSNLADDQPPKAEITLLAAFKAPKHSAYYPSTSADLSANLVELGFPAPGQFDNYLSDEMLLLFGVYSVNIDPITNTKLNSDREPTGVPTATMAVTKICDESGTALWSMCSSSGRLVFSDVDSDTRKTSIRITDYLS
ncbi:hypothetical protein D9611_011035 [Ephemerocybe angulata]|uniref:F-box domain-containing protein n=1 Tax=Ephemerocybe angulata TaxID=980116 RepID=A0A8H5F1J7_9AGAR|nr:hypothetical protein D9611_011035 [Tulosesus angulatus]